MTLLQTTLPAIWLDWIPVEAFPSSGISFFHGMLWTFRVCTDSLSFLNIHLGVVWGQQILGGV